jgi:DAK2 domain fusion protein YloV
LTEAAGTRGGGSANAAQMEMTTMDSAGLLAGLQAGSAWLEQNVAAVNALNVFPVPDGDTGTNMSLTMRAALAEVPAREFGAVSDLGKIIAHGALMGARGNSGVILSQILRGLARGMDAKTVLQAQDLALAFTEGAATAYKGVMKPVEGTILTVVRDAAQAATAVAGAGGTIREVLEKAVAEAQASVARTPSLLPVLAEAGVVDAGGQGLTYILEGMLRYLRGQSVEALAQIEEPAESHAHAPEGRYNYDTQFIVQGTALDVDAIRSQIATMGDSVLVVGDQYTVKVHVHCDQPGQALDYGISQGTVTHVIIENMQAQYEEFRAAHEAEVTPAGVPQAALPATMESLSDICVVAVVSGEGLKKVYESLGVSAVVPGGQTMNPSTQDLVQAIDGLACERVIVLPNNSNIVLTARQAAELANKEVAVVATRTVPQGIAALLAFNYQADLETNCQLMTEAAGQVQTVEITRAVRSVQINGLPVTEGQYIGLLNDDLVTASEDAEQVVRQVLERLDPDDYEIVTIYSGQDVTAEQAEALAETVRTLYPHMEVEVLDGGQAHYDYVISVE